MDLNRELPSQLRPYVRDGRISVIPAKRAARLLLLDRVAQAFEPGRRYPELAVNEILKALHDDHAALRRYLVDEDLLSRTPDGIYWRSGGTFLSRRLGRRPSLRLALRWNRPRRLERWWVIGLAERAQSPTITSVGGLARAQQTAERFEARGSVVLGGPLVEGAAG
jgi:hypothetical protein